MNLQQAENYMYGKEVADTSTWEHEHEIEVPEHFQIQVKYNVESGLGPEDPQKMLNEMVAVFDKHCPENV